MPSDTRPKFHNVHNNFNIISAQANAIEKQVVEYNDNASKLNQ